MKVWLATSQTTGYVKVYGSYEALCNDLYNLHQYELNRSVEESSEWKTLYKRTLIVDSWSQPNFENTSPSGWWKWESEVCWRTYKYPYEDAVTLVRVDVRVVLEDWDIAQ